MPSIHDYMRMFRRSGAKRIWQYFRENHLYDLQYGTDTATWKPTNLQGELPNIEHGHWYEATQTSRLRRCLEAAQAVGYGSDCAFVDLGCGKGKALLVAADVGYRRLTGVEYDPSLLAIAKKNLNQRNVSGEVLLMDASHFEPRKERTIIYMFNPFDSKIVGRVVERSASRDVLLIYSNPFHEDLFTGWRLLWRFGSSSPIGRDVLYASPSAGALA
jgi:SAM-dependent methyltransferase